MNTYNDYLKEIEARKLQGLHPKPIDGAELLSEIIAQIKDENNENKYEVNSENAFYNLNTESVSFEAKDKRVKSIIYF